MTRPLMDDILTDFIAFLHHWHVNSLYDALIHSVNMG